MHGDSLEVRMGTFFVVIGAGAFVLFVISDIAQKPDFDYFCGSLILLGIGFYFRRKKTPPPPADRFSYYRKWRSGATGKSKDKGKKEAKKK
jgi:hypothetical protein